MLIEIPEKYRSLLDKDDNLLSFMLEFLRDSSQVLQDNRVVFFRGYTDHGIDHIERVLRDSLRLVSDETLDLLTPADACVIIGSSVLHDFALHLSESAFAAVVNGEFCVPDSSLRPNGIIIPVDEDWEELWRSYIDEALRWGDISESRIFGPNFVRPSRDEYKSMLNIEASTRYSDEFGKPLIGEFIRRHHARLAHEIALAGFPGLKHDQFRILARGDFEMGDLVGFVARSHHLSMRRATDHVHHHFHGDLAPYDCHAAYCMALLRIVDYLQIDDVRAPTLLLRLRAPESPLSIDEWQKHAAVRPPSYTHEDSECIYFPVRQDHSYRTHLLLLRLLNGLQHELDETNASLRGVYRDHSELRVLRLKFSRIRSNVLEDDFAKRLPFVAEKVSLSVDPRIVSLIVEPLYENRPECGVRELMQNGIDAVLERESFETQQGERVPPVDYPDIPNDVRIVAKKDMDDWSLTFTDKGMGMTLEVIKNSFLRAGASFRDSEQWKEEFTDEVGRGRVSRSGKFGVGAFAAFLLGDSVLVTTRRVGSEVGYRFSYNLKSTEVEITKIFDIPFGTTIEIKLSNYSVEELELESAVENPGAGWDWFTLSHPNVARVIVKNGLETELVQEREDPVDFEYSSGSWRRLPDSDFDRVLWSIDQAQGGISCNGIMIGKPAKRQPTDGSQAKSRIAGASYGWDTLDYDLQPPHKLQVTDFEGIFPVTLQRHACEGHQPALMEKSMRADMAIDFVAYSLACAPREPFPHSKDQAGYFEWYPYLGKSGWFFVNDYEQVLMNRSEHLVWCHTGTEVMPFAPSVVAPLNFSKLVFQGSATQSLIRTMQPTLMNFNVQDSLHCCIKDHRDDFRYSGFNNVKCHFPFAAKLMSSISEGKYVTFGNVESVWCLLIGNIAEWKEMLKSVPLTIDQFEVAYEDLGVILYKFGDAEIDAVVTDQINRVKAFPKEIKHQISSVHIVLSLSDRVYSAEANGVLETTWIEYLGKRGIPFEPSAREELISEALGKDKRLKAYYDSWREFEPTYRKQVRRR